MVDGYERVSISARIRIGNNYIAATLPANHIGLWLDVSVGIFHIHMIASITVGRAIHGNRQNIVSGIETRWSVNTVQYA